MFRGILTRGDFWLIWLSVALFGASRSAANSCHEVKLLFQMRQIGPLKWVPDAPGPDGDGLQVCRHQGPTCCTRRMEVSYQAAARAHTLQNLRAYSFELKYLIVDHTAAFRDAFHSLLSFTQGLTTRLFDTAYEPLSRDARPLVDHLFADLSLFLAGDNATSVHRSVQRFYDRLFPLVYRRLVNPGLSLAPPSLQHSECLSMTRQDVGPFGAHPRQMAEALARGLRVGRALSRTLAVWAEVVNATERSGVSRHCERALVRMQYCPHCRGLTLIRPCAGLCLNVMRGCLVGLSELDAPWGRYMALLDGVLALLRGGQDLELALLGVRNHVNDAILHAQLHGPRVTAIVDKVCGPLTDDDTPLTTSVPPTLEVVTSDDPWVTPSPAQDREDYLSHSRRSLPLKPSMKDQPKNLKKIIREFTVYVQRYRSFFSELPEMLCDMRVDDFNCWAGEDVVESYVGHVVENGLQAQRQNPEVKVRGSDPHLLQAKERLEEFTLEMMGHMGWVPDWGERGSGAAEGSAGAAEEEEEECDDEDGCPGSGGHKDLIGEGDVSVDVASAGVPLDKTPALRDPPAPRVPSVIAVKTAAPPLGPSPALVIVLVLSLLALPWHPL